MSSLTSSLTVQLVLSATLVGALHLAMTTSLAQILAAHLVLCQLICRLLGILTLHIYTSLHKLCILLLLLILLRKFGLICICGHCELNQSDVLALLLTSHLTSRPTSRLMLPATLVGALRLTMATCLARVLALCHVFCRLLRIL